MKTKYPSMFGVLVGLLLLFLFPVIAVTSSAVPVSAQNDVAVQEVNSTNVITTMADVSASNLFITQSTEAGVLFAELPTITAAEINEVSIATTHTDGTIFNAVGLAGAMNPIYGDSTGDSTGYMLLTTAPSLLAPGVTLTSAKNSVDYTDVMMALSATNGFTVSGESYLLLHTDLELVATATATEFFSGPVVYLSAITQGGAYGSRYLASASVISGGYTGVTSIGATSGIVT
jgi:hypothetical protein